MGRLITLLAVFLTLLSSCTSKIVPEGPWVKKIDSEAMSRLVINYSVDMQKSHHVYLQDSWMAYDDSIKRMCLRYSSQRLLTLEEGRLLIVEMVEEFLKRVNNHAILGFEVETFPFSADNLDVQINFESFFGEYVDELYIGLIWLQCGCTHFYAFDRKDNNLDWDHHRFEPYFKSRELALLKKEADIPFQDQLLKPKKPSSFIYDRYEPYQPGSGHPPLAILPPLPPYSPQFFPPPPQPITTIVPAPPPYSQQYFPPPGPY